jgi:hypothetical protein
LEPFTGGDGRGIVGAPGGAEFCAVAGVPGGADVGGGEAGTGCPAGGWLEAWGEAGDGGAGGCGWIGSGRAGSG